MKKTLVMLIPIAAVFLLIAAGIAGMIWIKSRDVPYNDYAIISAEILSVSGEHFHVKSLGEYGGEYTFGVKEDTLMKRDGKKISVEDFSDGDTILIYCSNDVLYTHPMQIPKVYELILIERAEEGA